MGLARMRNLVGRGSRITERLRKRFQAPDAQQCLQAEERAEPWHTAAQPLAAATSWERLGTLFGSDSHRVAQRHKPCEPEQFFGSFAPPSSLVLGVAGVPILWLDLS